MNESERAGSGGGGAWAIGAAGDWGDGQVEQTKQGRSGSRSDAPLSVYRAQFCAGVFRVCLTSGPWSLRVSRGALRACPFGVRSALPR